MPDAVPILELSPAEAFNIFGIALVAQMLILRTSLLLIAEVKASFLASLGTAILMVIVAFTQSVLFCFAFFGGTEFLGAEDPSYRFGVPIYLAMNALILGATFELSFKKACSVELVFLALGTILEWVYALARYALLPQA